MSDNYSNIPEELKAIDAWVVWRYEDGGLKPTKVPYDAKTGKHASINDYSTWSSFAQAMLRIANSNNYNGIGFVFSDFDPYCFIDLDNPSHLPSGELNSNYAVDVDRQLKIFKEFDSYAEISPSGSGLHIIGRANIPSGRRRSFIEIYSSGRYATFTGHVYNSKPISDIQEKVTQLWEQMASGGIATTLYYGEANAAYNDDNIITQATEAVNGDKVRRLLVGDWTGLYPSQSEADFALIDILAFYSRNKTQIIRLFQNSELGKRDKAKRQDYLDHMIKRSFDRMLPPIDFDGFKNAIEEKLAAKRTQHIQPVQTNLPLSIPPLKEIKIKQQNKLTIPPGLMGELAQFIYSAAPRPVPEVALAGAIGLMAGICGRAYNVSNTGLNQYILLLGKTGIGKEGMAQGIDKLMNAIKFQVPTSANFIGPARINSGQALVKYIHKKSNCFVSIVGEFGKKLEHMSNFKANAAERVIIDVLLELYNKSGYYDIYRPSIYSDLEKNTDTTVSPAFSLLGESTPHSFYSILNEDMITDGLLPRFMIVEYTGARPELSKTHATTFPSSWLVDKLASLIANVETIMHAKRVINVQLDPQALIMMDDFDKYATMLINQTQDEVILNLWNRAHIKALKISALIAVGVNMIEPIITEEYCKWAIEVVTSDIKALAQKFEKGEIGQNSFEVLQVKEMARIIKEYATFEYEKVKKYEVPEKLHQDKVITYQYIFRRLVAIAAFRNDRIGATNSIKRTLTTYTDSDKIREVGRADMTIKYGTTQRAFVVKDMTLLD